MDLWRIVFFAKCQPPLDSVLTIATNHKYRWHTIIHHSIITYSQMTKPISKYMNYQEESLCQYVIRVCCRHMQLMANLLEWVNIIFRYWVELFRQGKYNLQLNVWAGFERITWRFEVQCSNCCIIKMHLFSLWAIKDQY